MFLHDCILNKNTPEIRNKLIEIGYEPFIETIKDSDKSIITVSKNGKGPYFITYTFLNEFDEPDDDYIYCGTNEKIFLSIAAMRDDSDFMQWFRIHGVPSNIFGENYMELCTEEYWLSNMHHKLTRYTHPASKATIKEIFDKFK